MQRYCGSCGPPCFVVDDTATPAEIAVSSQTCSRCHKVIEPGDLFYRLLIKVFADFDGVINIKKENMDLNAEFEKIRSYPENLLEEEVYKEFDFILCPRCKEIYCANPLHLPLDSR